MVKKTGNNVKVVVYTDAPEVELFLHARRSTSPVVGQEEEVQQEGHRCRYTYQVHGCRDKSNTNHENLYLLFGKIPYADGTIWAKYDENGQELDRGPGRPERDHYQRAATQLEATRGPRAGLLCQRRPAVTSLWASRTGRQRCP